MALLILLATAAGTRIVASDLGAYFDGFLSDGLRRRVIIAAATFLYLGRRIAGWRGSYHFILTHFELAHIRLLLPAFAKLLAPASGRDGAMTKEADDILVDLAVHTAEQLEGLHFIDHQRVFLLQVSRLHALLQVVHATEMFLPGIVDDGQCDLPFHGIHQLPAFRAQGLLQIGMYIDRFLTTCERHDHIFDMIALGETYILKDRQGMLAQLFQFTFIILRGFLVQFFRQLIDVPLQELLFGDLGIDPEIDDSG